MLFHENHLLADDSHEISYLIFPQIMKDRCREIWRLLQSYLALCGLTGINVWSTIAYYFVTLFDIPFMQTVQTLMRRRFRPELFANIPVMDLSG